MKKLFHSINFQSKSLLESNIFLQIKGILLRTNAVDSTGKLIYLALKI